MHSPGRQKQRHPTQAAACVVEPTYLLVPQTPPDGTPGGAEPEAEEDLIGVATATVPEESG